MKFLLENGYYRAENAIVLGDVIIGKDSGIWFYSVIRGDEARISIGERVNVQDLSVLHTNKDEPLHIGNDVTIGHSAVIHCKKIGNACMIGMNATIMQGVEIGDGCIIGGGAVIPEGKIIPDRSVVVGVPGKIIKQVSDEEYAHILDIAKKYCAKAQKYAR